MIQLRYDPRFPEDLGKALDWYDQISTEASEKLRELIQRQLNSIQQFPASFQLLETDRGHRGAMVSGFPLMIVFRIEENVIRILQIVHLSSDWTQS